MSNNSQEDLNRRVDYLETSYRDLVEELRESNRTMNKLAIDIHTLAVNVSHLTPFIEGSAQLKDRCYTLEKDIALLKVKVEDFDEVKGKVNTVSKAVTEQGSVTGIMKVIGTSLITSGAGIFLYILIGSPFIGN